MAYTLSSTAGTVRFLPDVGTINREQERLASQVTSSPIEGGGDVNDHVINEPVRLTLRGVLIGGEAAKATLKKMRLALEPITYTGKTRANNLVFTNLDFTSDPDNKDGYALSATLQQVDIAAAQIVDVGALPLPARPVQNIGTQTTQRTGVTNTQYAEHVRSFNGNASAAPNNRVTPPSLTGMDHLQ